MILFLLLGIGIFSGVQSQAGTKTCKNNYFCDHIQDEGVDCHGDCYCRDNMADECGRPHPTTAVHTDSISACMDNCKVFALEGRCKFIIFHFDNIDENCIIMNDDYEAYVSHCNERGQPLWGPEKGQGLARWTGCQNAERCQNEGYPASNFCNTCTDCSNEGCRGYLLSSCTIYSEVLESSNQISLEHCEIWARTTKDGTYMHYDREQAMCQVYGGMWSEFNGLGFDRECRVAIVELGTDPNECQDVKPTVPPTTAPPECTSDLECKPGEICLNNICTRGCRSSADCGVHPCSCTGECQDNIDPCHWCTATGDQPGMCTPGCADDSDCKDALICNGQHQCILGDGTVLQSITMFTKTCDGCAGTPVTGPVETGVKLVMKGKPGHWTNTTCEIENLDHPDRVDYQDNTNSEFKSQDGDLGTCNYANFNGYDMDMFTMTWNGQGKWNPSKFELRFTGMTDPVTCPYVGSALDTGRSETLTCKRE